VLIQSVYRNQDDEFICLCNTFVEKIIVTGYLASMEERGNGLS